jgi:hypothetical protein
MALTLTPPAAANVYSDGISSNHVTIAVKNAVGPLARTILTGTVTPAGRVIIKNKSDASGKVLVAIATASSGPLTLTLTDPATGESGTCALTATTYDFGGFQYSPPNITVPSLATITAQLYAKGQQTPADKIPLKWVAATVPAPKYLPPLQVTTDKSKPSTFEYVSLKLQQSDIDALHSSPIQMHLEIGGDSSFFYPAQVATGAPLLAPAFALPPAMGTTINDEMILVCASDGIPFRIPSIVNTSLNDTITLLASQTPTGPSVAVLTSQPIASMESDGVDSLPFITYVPTSNLAFDANGPLYIYYSVYRALTGALSLSDRLQSKVDRTDGHGAPDGIPDPRLTPPDTDINVYSLANLDNGDPMNVTINFNGAIQPSIGDSITPKIYLVGYTAANFNWVKQIELLPAYTLTAADFVNGVYTPKNFVFTSDKFIDIDGSNGQLYFLYQQGQSSAIRSPARSIIVDTVAPEDSSLAALSTVLA